MDSFIHLCKDLNDESTKKELVSLAQKHDLAINKTTSKKSMCDAIILKTVKDQKH